MTLREEVIGDCRLICGDSLSVLQTLESGCASAIVCDPPYSSGALYRAGRAQSQATKYVQSGAAIEYGEYAGDNMDAGAWSRWCREWMRDCLRLSVDNGYLLSFCDWRQSTAVADAMQWAGWNWAGMIAWDKGLGSRAGNTSMFRHQCEFIPWATKGNSGGYRDRSGPWPGCFRINSVPPQQRVHQAEKPIELMLELISVTNPGETVVDPFMGSARTGVACVRTGRKFIGIELETWIFELACEEIAREVQLAKCDLFKAEKPVAPVVVPTLFT